MTETTNTTDTIIASPDVAKIPTLNIGDKSYPVASLSDLARAQIANLQIVEAEITRLQNQIGIAQAAKASFVATLQTEVAKLS
ncbi:MAG TPA: hypothetical protein DCS43_12210 [Verrucomicrobia bacterium]|nr:hypothetical protein [Verrucomicrobiota bacterium]